MPKLLLFREDRYIIIGNHRDAWGYGAIDPSSGTACLVEMSRVFGALLKDGELKGTRGFRGWPRPSS